LIIISPCLRNGVIPVQPVSMKHRPLGAGLRSGLRKLTSRFR
jgi:hypothetical protein